MKKEALVIGLAFVFLAGGAIYAEDTNETKLQAEEQHIDKDTSARDNQKAEALAKQYDVPAATVQDLRNKGQGWGEITIGLATAQQLEKTDPKTYPTEADALAKVESMRASGEGWGKIAKDLGFKLGPVVSAAHHSRHEMRESLHEERVEHHHHEMMEHPEKPEHPQRPERPGH